MPKNYPNYLLFILFALSASVSAQTVLSPGDIAVLGVATDMGGCGLPAESDEISFVCFKDITPFTDIFLTDNGWETSNAGLWGDSEGTLRLFRLGPVLPKGTVITLQAVNNAGNWTYQVISDNGWVVQNINTPGGGPFNLEPGGDQFYFLSGGVWSNNGAGGDDATFTGNVVYGFNTLATWAANGTTHQSNLNPSVIPCFNMSSGGAEYYKYISPLTPDIQLDWWHRVQDPVNWMSFIDCATYKNTPPIYSLGYSIVIDDMTVGTSCHSCNGCSPLSTNLDFDLPPGTFDITYTDGTNTFTLNGVQDGDAVPITVIGVVTYTLLTVTEVGGCPILPPYTAAATFSAPHHNPGLHRTLVICPDYGLINMPVLLGPHDPGGQWIPPLDPINGIYYSTFWGPGTYHYIFFNPGCPPDSASISVYLIDPSQSTVDIGCDQNGTPNDITDDRMTVTLNFIADGFGPTYWVWPAHFGVPTGTITPGTGVVGTPTTFILDPGTATTTNLSLVVQDLNGFACIFKFQLPPPGFCSDPCDPDMTATISGDEETCPNSCPDNPAHIYIDVTGGLPDYSMDFSVTANGFPTWNFTNVPINQNAEIQICVDNVAVPSYDPISGSLVVPKLLAGSDMIITLLNVNGKYGCTATLDNAVQIITIHPLPLITTLPLKWCKGIANDINLTDYDLNINTFLDVSWYDGDPLQGGDIINSPTGANLFNVQQLWALVSDDYCSNSIQVPFTLLPQPNLDSVPPQQICYGNNIALSSIHLNDAGMSSPVYTFHSGLPPDTTNKLNPLIYVPLDTTTIYVLATAGTCYDTIPVVIDVQDNPDFTLQGTPCDLLLNTYSVLFTSNADSIHADTGIVVNNLNGQDTIKGIPDTVNVTIEIFNGTHLCRDTFLIIAPNCNCPAIAQPVAGQPSYEICVGEPVPVLSVTIDPGLSANWYDVPSGGVPLMQNSLTYQPASGVNAIYYVEAADASLGCYSIRTQIPFIVNPVADLQVLADPTLCETETINLNTLVPTVLNGVSGNGQWYDLNTNLPVSGIIQPQNGDSWYYLFTSNPGNCTSSDAIQATVNVLPTIDIFDITCIDVSLTYQVGFTSDADIVMASTGILSHPAGTDSFFLTNIPYNTNIQFDLQNTTTGCTSSVSQAAPNCSCPTLLQSNNTQICSDQAALDLTTFVGFGVTGSWQLVSTPPGANPATLVGSNFLGQNKDAGIYVLRFIRSILISSCVDTAAFQITLHQAPFADAGSNATVCAPDVILLSGTAGGTNVVFNWQENGTGSIANPNALNTSYTPTLADITAGSVKFTLTATDQTGFCPLASETITITIDGSAYFIVNAGSQVYCDTSDVQVDFDDLISFGNKNGKWFFPDTVNATITGSSKFIPSTLAAGNYTVFYTSTNAVAPCKNDTVGVNLIIRDCACPSVALSIPSQGLCSDAGTQDLNAFLLTAEPGTWSIVGTPPGSKPAVLNGSNFVTNNSDQGIYLLRFTLKNPVAGCEAFSEISFEVIATPSLQISSVKCAADLQSWQATITSTSANITNTQGTLTSLGGNQYLIDGLTLLANVVVTASNGGGLCTNNITIPAPDCACTLSISNLPNNITLCPGEKTTLDATVNGGKGAVTSFWVLPNDSLYQNSLEVSTAGTYHFVSMDALGCRQEKFVDVSYYTEMVPDANVVDIRCPGDQDGQIILNNIIGGNGPFFISVNGGVSQPVTFPYIISGLKAGIYKIDLLDGFSCSISFNLNVASASAETLSLGQDKVVLVGDSVLIHPVLSFVPDSFYWTGDLSLIDQFKLDNWDKPEVDQTFTLYAIDSKGCLYSDDLNVKVLLHSSVIVPSVFSPNGDGNNDYLTPMSDPSVTNIDYFEIFSRWGELVYSAKNFAPNQANFGWDGTLRGKPMQPGVYVYQLSSTNKKGNIMQQTGDVTLMR